jgi:hypothetical protein
MKMSLKIIDADVTNIDMEDPEVEKAALIIQAGYCGPQTKKHLKNVKPEIVGELNNAFIIC